MWPPTQFGFYALQFIFVFSPHFDAHKFICARWLFFACMLFCYCRLTVIVRSAVCFSKQLHHFSLLLCTHLIHVSGIFVIKATRKHHKFREQWNTIRTAFQGRCQDFIFWVWAGKWGRFSTNFIESQEYSSKKKAKNRGHPVPHPGYALEAFNKRFSFYLCSQHILCAQYTLYTPT